MSELNEAALKLLYDEELFIVKEKTYVQEANKTETEVVSEPAPEPITIKFKGDNKKGIVILFENDKNEALEQSDETLLLNILKAVGLSLEDVALLNHHTIGVDWKGKIEANKVLVFGTSPTAYSISCDTYAITENESKQWLFSHSLSELANDKQLKAKLWGKLQELFPS